MDGKSANGKAVVEHSDEQNEWYTVLYYQTDSGPPELIERVTEGRLLTVRDIEVL
ncbi:hypothetical protein [Mucilaginibacter sp. RCC_168]|uniref:hypothetical protein n=1 Tax=Mucilaginibacter sp. RCC_168 TaxID=3239221 RepID=UPI00352486CA